MNKKCTEIKAYLDEILPNARCALNYNKDYELVIAVMLSAQTTDVAVNKVTEKLFTKFPSLESFYNAKLQDIEDEIKTLGMFKVKAKNIINIAKDLVEKFTSKVPQEKEKLTTLAGVGNKTANVVRAELFEIPEIAVDTHILRISKRLDLASLNDEPIDVEIKLRKNFLRKDYIKLHHQLIWFGRIQCKAKNPLCDNCKIKKYCNFVKK